MSRAQVCASCVATLRTRPIMSAALDSLLSTVAIPRVASAQNAQRASRRQPLALTLVLSVRAAATPEVMAQCRAKPARLANTRTRLVKQCAKIAPWVSGRPRVQRRALVSALPAPLANGKTVLAPAPARYACAAVLGPRKRQRAQQHIVFSALLVSTRRPMVSPSASIASRVSLCPSRAWTGVSSVMPLMTFVTTGRRALLARPTVSHIHCTALPPSGVHGARARCPAGPVLAVRGTRRVRALRGTSCHVVSATMLCAGASGPQGTPMRMRATRFT